MIPGGFAACGKIFTDPNSTKAAEYRQQYGWRGSLWGLERNETSQISYEGCVAICGTGSDPYSWTIASSTITTWLLPVVGVLLQAPFESNAFVSTIFALARWIGSPMASLSYILWNIKVSGKCALMVDMATKYEDSIYFEDSDQGNIRDSFYILLTMNQYTMNPRGADRKEAEGLLRIVLFSKSLRLLRTKDSLREARRELAQKLRRRRRRGTVPVFVSTLWFLFALGLSIQAAFGYLGENATAHDLALGFLLSWLPVIILGSIVDRNPMASEDVRLKLNALMDHVRESLQDPEIRREFVQSFSDQAESERLGMWIEEIARHSRYMDNFFVHFAGQGRVRWHYGAAHPIISDIEDCYIADKGRNWLEHEEEARISLVLGKVKDGLLWFDVRELWQVLSAVTIVLGGLAGAFCLSYFTPTIGLGCRSGGYVIFATNSFGLLLLEFLIWWLASPLALVKPPERMRRGLSNSPYFRGIENSSRGIWTSVKWAIASFSKKIDRALVRVVIAVASLAPRHDKEDYLRRLEDRMISKLQALHSQTLQQGTERFFLRPAEIINAGWLFWVSIAQTFGIYRTCDCVTSRWGRGGGYLDFTQSTYTDIDLVKYSWKIGTAIATTSIGFSMSYIVLEWCLQSHLSTENYEDASRGLRKTRYYRRLTMPFRRASRTMFSVFGSVSCWAFKSTKLKFRDQKSLLWTQKITSNRPPVTAHKFSSVSEPAPSIELSYIEGHSPLTDLYRVFSAESDDTSYRPLVQTPEMARQVSSRSFRSDSASFAPSGISPHASPYPSGRVSPQSVQDKSQSESESGLEKSKARAPSRGALEVPTFRVSYTRKTTDEVVHRRQQASPDGIGTDEVAASEDRSTAGVGRQMQEEELLGAGGGLMISYNLDAPSSGEGDGPH